MRTYVDVGQMTKVQGFDSKALIKLALIGVANGAYLYAYLYQAMVMVFCAPHRLQQVWWNAW